MTIKEIAQLAGVSTTTVSRIINNKAGNIHPATIDRVLKIVKEYNYTPYGTFKGNSGAKSFSLGVLLRARFSSALLDGILLAAQEYGYTLSLLNSRDDPETEAHCIAKFCGNHVDGILWDPISDESAACISKIERHQIPFLLLRKCADRPFCQIDFETLGYRLTEKLVEHRHTNLFFLCDRTDRGAIQLLSGFQKCLYDHQIPYSPKMYADTSASYTRHILDSGATGIVCASLQTSLELCKQMELLHCHMSSDYSLVCPKDSPVPSCFEISGIAVPYQEFGYHVGKQLIQSCEGSTVTAFSEDFYAKIPFETTSSLGTPPFLQRKRFVVVGSIHMDITFHVDLLPQHGKTTTILNAVSSLGGKGINQSVGIARLGREVSLIGKIGSDPESSFIFKSLSNENVSTKGILRDKEKPLGKAYIFADHGGESAISILPGANFSLTPDDIYANRHLFKNAGYCLISTEIPLDSAITAARTARQYGCQTILKPAALEAIPEQLLKHTDIFIPNRKEAATLCPNESSIERQADFFYRHGCPIVIITLGHNGCYLKSKEHAAMFPASDFVPVDTTGGADAFIAALAVCLTDGLPLCDSISIASYAAGFCIARQGVISSLIDKNTLEAHLAKSVPQIGSPAAS